MGTVDLKTQIIGLVNLQEVDSEIYSLKNEKEAKPLEIKAIESAFDEKKANLAQLEKKSLDLQKQRKEKELELGSKEEAGKKLQGQLYSLKTNKEYQTMLQQIQDAKADGELVEEKILILFEEADNVKKEIAQENIKIKEEEKVFLEQKNKIQIRISEIDEKLAGLESKRKQLTPGLDTKVFSAYERILNSRDGLAIVTVIDNSCAGCHMNVPPQVINLIKMYERIVTCEVCNRILYIKE
ncbi:MAG: C4-type zinc ribbon domain-containing protein [Candidatus Omnitrophica bacterium]|nr:C4-type zinc ribbon domain-containing protein [Candidatus Omnitrophota bacterium]